MAVNLIVGTQWGDEGKAKVIDYLAGDTDIIVRYQGGANAGHTVEVDGKKYIFHLIPSGVLYPDTICLLSGGMVIDPEALFEEVSKLEEQGIDTKGRIRIADNAHLLLPYHKIIDAKREENPNGQKIGTTKRGIGVCYGDKVNRWGIRMGDLLCEDFYSDRLGRILDIKNKVLTEVYGAEPVKKDELESYLRSLAEKIKDFLVNTSYYLNMEISSGKNVLLEGAQGTMLDLDFGTYPYVTSSNPTTGGALIGSGISFQNLQEVIGITKAYVTRVGEGPFPTEIEGEDADKLRELGREYGSTTGRPRRVGWFDVEVVRHSVRVNGLTSIALTKLDVLDTYDKIKVAVGYEQSGKRISYFPTYNLSKVTPIYEEFEGWQEDITQARNFHDLPKKAKRFIQSIEKFIGVPVRWVSVGPGRENTIKLK